MKSFLNSSNRVWFADGPTGIKPTEGSAYWWSLDDGSDLWLTTAHEADVHRNEYAWREFPSDPVIILETVIRRASADESVRLPASVSRYLGIRDRPAEQYLDDFHIVPVEINQELFLGVGISFDSHNYIASVFNANWVCALYPGPERFLRLSVTVS
ncbi:MULTISPECIES: hypothetical protein [Gordonia]|uniref:hypothetical protein n=1 Tax=Gordonia TaxID=2053 RepID=UPI0032B39E69